MGSSSHSSKRKKKRSQKRSKKNGRSIREKTKKLKRRRELPSSSDEDSASPSSQSCSSLEHGHRSKRTRSRDRKYKKGHKKRVTRGRSVSESSEDSPRVKKRKRSRRNGDSDLRKKRRTKKHKREPSSSSSSGQYRSWSTGESSDNSLRESQRKEEKLEKTEKGRQMGRESTPIKSAHSSRSCSPYSFNSERHNCHSEERLMENYQPKRLKSVIVARTEAEEPEVKESNRESQKDEIIYEYDDYPSRSNDSNDGVNRRESLLYIDDATNEKERSLGNPYGEDVSAVVRTSELLVNQCLDMGRASEKGLISSSVLPGDGNQLKGNGISISTADASSNPNNLEAILRQKALENLLKRQGKLPRKIPADMKESHSGEVRKSSSLQSEAVWHKLDEEASIHSVQKTGKCDDVKHNATAPGALKDNGIHPPIRNLEIGIPAEKGNSSGDQVISRPKLGLSTSTKRLLGSRNTWKRELTSHESFQPSLSKSKETADIDSARVSKSLSSDTKLVTDKVDSAAASEPSPSGGKSTKDETIEDNEDSEFQQKTMSVMRGGEMVQVSYKVKIPKKVPALTRRLLKR